MKTEHSNKRGHCGKEMSIRRNYKHLNKEDLLKPHPQIRFHWHLYMHVMGRSTMLKSRSYKTSFLKSDLDI